MKRREMLRMGTAALALTLTGCKKKPKTVVNFVNASNGAVSVNGMAGGLAFVTAAIQIGGIASQTYKPNVAAGTVVPLTGDLILPVGTLPIPAGATVTVGKINTFTLTGDVLANPPVVNILTAVQ